MLVDTNSEHFICCSYSELHTQFNFGSENTKDMLSLTKTSINLSNLCFSLQ